MKILLYVAILGAVTAATNSFSADYPDRSHETPALAAKAINELGLDLLAKGTAGNANALLSPYSIQSALAMTYAGAAGETRAEMARVLHYPADEAGLDGSFSALRTRLEALTAASAKQAKRARQWGETLEPLTLTMANRLFGEAGYEFRAPFLAVTKDIFGTPFQAMNFEENPGAARTEINSWVEEQTKQRIRDLIPSGALNKNTRLVLVNAIYLKAAWAESFQARMTKPEPFHVKGGNGVDVPTMQRKDQFGYRHVDDFTVVTLPYSGGDLQLLVVLPDAANGLSALESKMTAEKLASLATPPPVIIILHLPKFKLHPPVMRLGETLQSMGMKTAFDMPRGSANFDRMAPRKPDDYLKISDVYHKTFLDLDENGTEAAAATAVVMMRTTAMRPIQTEPIEVKVDRPFLFAIQQRSTGACLFLGRVVDPR